MRKLILTLLALLTMAAPLHAATGTVSPYVALQFFDNNGDPCNACQLFTYTAGTSTKVSTYTDVGLSVANTNPIVLDSSGRATIFLTPGVSYKYVLSPSTDTDPPVAPIWTRDNISAVPPSSTAADTDVSATAGESLASGDLVCLSDGGGGNTAGRWYKCDADFTYLSNLAPATGFATAAISTGSTGTVRRLGRVTGLSGLVAGTLYYASATAGALTSTKPTNARAVGTADSTTTLVLAPTNIDASSTFSGLVSTGTQTLAGAKTFSSAATFSAAAVLSLGATFASGNTLGNMIVACSSSDATKNANVTLSDVTGIAFAVEASATYEFLFILHGTSNSAADFKLGLTGPAAVTAIRFGAKTDTAGLGAADSAAIGTAIHLPSQGVDEAIIIGGRLRNGANAGTIQLQFAQEASTGSDSKIYAESCVIALKI